MYKKLAVVFLIAMLITGCRKENDSSYSSSGAAYDLASLNDSSAVYPGDSFGGSGEGSSEFYSSTNPVHRTANPEPASIILLGMGLSALAAWKLKNKRRS